MVLFVCTKKHKNLKVDEDGEDETEGVYIAKLEKLQQEVPLRSATRSTLGAGRALVIDQLICCVNSFRETTMSSDPKFDHSDLVEKQKVMNECVKQRLLRERKQLQDLQPKYATPVIFSADIERRPALDSHLCNSGEQLRSNMVKSLTAAKEGISDKGEVKHSLWFPTEDPSKLKAFPACEEEMRKSRAQR